MESVADALKVMALEAHMIQKNLAILLWRETAGGRKAGRLTLEYLIPALNKLRAEREAIREADYQRQLEQWRSE